MLVRVHTDPRLTVPSGSSEVLLKRIPGLLQKILKNRTMLGLRNGENDRVSILFVCIVFLKTRSSDEWDTDVTENDTAGHYLISTVS